MQLWGGRFSKATDELVRQFNDSIGFDQRLFAEDIEGSQAWAQGLVGAGILTQTEADTLRAGLDQVRKEWVDGTFELKAGDEDIHTANERRLTEIVGDVGGKLHTGRSRNDQVGTDFRLWTMRAIEALTEQLLELCHTLVANAEQHVNVVMPGFTHLQHAQPITWGHWIMSHCWPLIRDAKRLQQAYDSADNCPLGSAALAGTAFPVDRHWLAHELGFSRITPNSLDAVSDRDFVVDFLYACAMIGTHLSRLSEQLIIFSSQEFGYVRLDDAFSTGSSLMPQKKNPDTLELTRGKSGRLIGRLIGMMTTLKGLPSTYDKDLQEDKQPVFDAFDTLMIVVPVMAGAIGSLTINAETMASKLKPGLLATDLADYLVRKGMPFRQAHHIVGQVIQSAENQNMAITDLSLTDLQSISNIFEEDVAEALRFEGSLKARSVIGGTAPSAVRQQIKVAVETLGMLKTN